MVLLLDKEHTLRVMFTAHDHWCPEHDRRWICTQRPCLLYDAAPCREDTHEA